MGIFEPFRAIGYITGTVPISVQRLGTETFATVSVGKAFKIYDCAKLNVVTLSPLLPKKIRAFASFRDYTFVAFGNEIAVFRRAHQVATWSKHVAKVDKLLLFGEHVLSLDVEGNMFMWEFKGIKEDAAPVGHVEFSGNFTPTCIVHPDTHLNKVLVGSQEGPLQLWNISTKKMIHEFKGWGSSVCSCVSSPALDVVAIGCADGKIHVHDIRLDNEIVTFEDASRGAVTALSFITDGRPLLASGGSSGVISIWNLKKKCLKSVIRDAHDKSIISLNFLANEPVLISSSADNSVKMWIFDTNDVAPRLLRFRSGHSAPPKCIRFYSNGRHILSAGEDRAFRLFSVIQEQQSRELSQKHISRRAKKLRLKEEELKLKPVIAFDCAEIRERDWCNVVTCHKDTAEAYVWRLQNFVLGEHILKPCRENPTSIKACAISACGNFAVVGTAGGWIERFNLQSGISRGSYLDMSEKRGHSHDGEVIGVACDSTNTLMISAGYHGDVKVWDFKKRVLNSRWDVGCTLVKIVYHRVNGLLATVVDDFVIRLYDVVALKMVREFKGHTDRITDVCFSEDGKWLISSSMDGTLRIWDVILAKQIDGMHVGVPITALSLSPNMDILATIHSDKNGIYLWVNQSMFSGAPNVNSYASGQNVVNVRLPSVSALTSSEADDDIEMETQVSEGEKAISFSISPKQIPELVTLSLLPKSQWQSLINLDIIKARNKPIEPPKKPEKAPFFLPSVPSLSGDILFKPNESEGDEESQEKNKDSKNSMKNFGSLESPFSKLLKSSWDSKNFSDFTDYIKGLSPSALDMELRMLEIIDEEAEEELIKRPEFISIGQLLDYFIKEITCRNNFEFMQAVVRLFLKIHGETIRCHPSLQEKARKLLETQSLVWQKMEKIFQSTRCMVTFLSNSQFC
ncbi:unnamed protein product [Microthlaspi erraticum]|uniref:Uncharacterized protein n=1 Tax=Microthlaspi erraticum TaxID=1685480 RepID=A0A6D2KQ89_9BRAS|nr:unnamed protein product [Microthlaspi erraticum]